MKTLMEILTLQNATFNMWAWVIGAIILLVITGMNSDNDPERSILSVFIALVWPIALVASLIPAIIALPILLGMKIKRMIKS